ncbi:MAG: anti-sigma factor family protein [Anaerolineales bacterium]
MTDLDGIARRDLERLSAFLDGELSSAEAEKLGARLATDKQLSRTLEALRATAETVRSLPEVSPPRSFALTDEMVRPRRAYPFLQLSTAVAALGFVLVVGADLLLSSSGGSALDVPEQAFFVADQLAPEAEQQPADPAPAEAPALEEAIMEEAESELAVAAEPEAESVGDADDRPAQGLFRSEEDAAGEELAEQGAAEREAVAEEELAGEGALKADAEQEPSAEELIVDRDLAEDEPSLSLSPFRVIEIGLGVAVIVLVGLTLWVRQRG